MIQVSFDKHVWVSVADVKMAETMAKTFDEPAFYIQKPFREFILFDGKYREVINGTTN